MSNGQQTHSQSITMVSRTLLLALAVVAYLAVCTLAHPLDDELEAVFRSRRTAQGVMRGYAGISRGRNPLAFAGGYAAHTRYVPRYVARPSMVQEEEVEPEQDEQEEQPMEDEEEEPMEDEEQEDEEEPAPVAPVKPQRPSRARPQRPRQDEEMSGRGGVTAIANSVSRGNGATSSSHAVAYGGGFSGGQFKHRF